MSIAVQLQRESQLFTGLCMLHMNNQHECVQGPCVRIRIDTIAVSISAGAALTTWSRDRQKHLRNSCVRTCAVPGTYVSFTFPRSQVVGESQAPYISRRKSRSSRFYARKGLFQPLFRDRAVLLSNGKLAWDSHQALVFLNQKLDASVYGPLIAAQVHASDYAHSR